MLDSAQSTSVLSWLKNRLARSLTLRRVAFVYSGDLGSKFISVANTWILIRLLTEYDYATFTIFFGFANFSAALVGTGFHASMVRYSAEFLDRHSQKPFLVYRVTLRIVIIAFLSYATLVFFFSEHLAVAFYGTRSAGLPIRLGLLLGFGVLLVEYSRAVFQGEERFSRFVATLWARQGLILLALVSFWLTIGLDFRSAAVVFASISLVLGGGLALGAVLRGKPSPNASDSSFSGDSDFDFSEYFRSFGWLIGYHCVLASFSQFDVMFISSLKGEIELATYGVAFRYYVAGIMVLSSLHAVLRPRFSKAANLTAESRTRFFRAWLLGSLTLIVPLVLFAAFGRGLFTWINGAEYARSFDVLRILLFCVWQAIALSPLVNILIGLKRFRTMSALGIAGLLTSLSLNSLLVPAFGAIGAAIATTTAYSTINVGALIAATRARAAPEEG